MKEHTGNKYHRIIHEIGNTGKTCTVDVYAVLEAFDVRCPARQHAVKKLLCSGVRGKGDYVQDIKESLDAIQRAIEMQKIREQKGVVHEL